MKVQKMSRKVLEKTVDQIFTTYCHGVQFDIFDLGKVLNAIRSALLGSFDQPESERMAYIEARVLVAVATYRKN